MKRNSVLSCIKIVLAGLVLPTLLSSSCGRAPVEYLDETVGTVEVTGAFADWTPGTSSFAGGRFILLDAATNEVFISNEIDPKNPKFEIKNVPVSGKYYGILIDSRFEPRAYFQKSEGDTKKLRVFKLGNSVGNLGTVVVRDERLEPSQQGDLEFQNNIGVSENATNANKPFEKEFNPTFTANPDIDEDGIPNVLDIDVDGDVSGSNGATIKYNIFDAFTYNKSEKIPDSSIPWQYNYAHGIPKLGFFKCNFLRSPVPPTSASPMPAHAQSPSLSFEKTYSCSLKLPAGFAQSVELLTAKNMLDLAKGIDGKKYNRAMLDDGNIDGNVDGQSGDLIRADGIWTGNFKITEAQIDSFRNQLIFATAKLSNGIQKTFVTTLEPKSIIENGSLNGICPSAPGNLSGFRIGLNLDAAKADLHKFNLSLRFISANGEPLSKQPPPIFLEFESPKSFKLKDIDSSISLPSGDYFPMVKIAAPSALPGILGSAFEFYIPTMQINFDDDGVMTHQCTPQ